MTEAAVSFAGNLTDQPEVRYTDSGITRAMFRVAVSGRREQEPSFFTVIVWRDQAEHAAESLAKGSRVVVVGPFDRKAAARIASGYGQGQDRLHGAANGLSPRHRGLQQR
jgi:Single-strand binding protein family